MANAKFVKTAAAVALGTSVVATAVAPSASAATTYKIKSGKLVNAKTGKVVKGYKTFKSVLYKDGKKYTGLRSGKYYKKGVLTSGTYKGIKYKKGVKFTGISSSDNKYYKNGVVGTGTYKDVKYKKGLPFTGVSTANGKYYQDGLVLTGANEDGVVYIEGVKDEVAPVITAEDQTVAYDAKDVDVLAFAKAEDNSKEEIKVAATITFEGKEVPAIDTTKAGEYTVTYAAQDANGNKAEKAIKVTVEAGELALDSVKATTLNTAVITFTKEVEDLKAADLAVANKTTSEKQVVKSVKLSDDKKSATVEFYSNVAANTTYTVALTQGQTKAEGELVIGSLAVATIDAEATQVVSKGSTVAYKLFTADGIELTKDQLSKQTVVVEALESVLDSKGEVVLANGTSGKATIKVVNEDKTIAASKEVTLNSEDATVKSIGTVTTNGKFDKDASTTIFGKEGKVEAQFLNQFGKELSAEEAKALTVSFESQNLDIAVVNKTDGTVTALKSGVVPVKVSVLDKDGKVVVSKTVEITVKDQQTATTVTADKTAELLSTKGGNFETTVSVKDQYGEAFNADLSTEVKSVDKDGKETTVVTADAAKAPQAAYVKVDDKTGEYKVTVTAANTVEAGTYNVYIKAGDKAVAVVKVTVKAPGTAVDYKLNATDKLDLAEGSKVKTVAQYLETVSLDKIDAEGLVTEEEKAVSYKVTGAKFDKNELKAGEELKVGDTFTVEAVVGLSTVKSQVVTVVDTTAKYTADFTQYTISTTDNLTTALKGKVTVAKDGKAVDTTKVTDVTAVDLISTDETLVSNEGVVSSKATDASATVLVKSITVTVEGQATTISFETPVKLTVNVAATPAK